MKLSIERDELLRGLGRVQAIVERRGTMPILANVLIEARTDGLTLAATDLEVAVVANHPATVKTPGSVTLGAKKLYEIVRELEGPEVELASEDGARVTLTCGPAKFQLLSTSPEEYPTIASADGVGTVHIGLAFRNETFSRKYRFWGNREQNKMNSAVMALDWVRRVLHGNPFLPGL